MADGEVLPRSMMNDNWWGYVDNWVYECNVTWMEKACSSPYWTGLMLFCIDQQSHGRRKHLLQEPLYQQEGRIAWKGQLLGAAMDGRSMLEQLEKMAKQDTHISLPITGAVLAARMRVVVTSGLVDVGRLLRQATVRRNVVVHLIRMHRDAGHPDYVNVDMRRVNRQAEQLAPTDDAAIPNGLAEFFNEGAEEFVGVDKAATPAERTFSEADLARDLERGRPLLLVPQRDSDANKDVEASRTNAFSKFAEFDLQTGSNLEPQFCTSYIPRVFQMTFPWCVSGPDFEKQKRWRRPSEVSPEAPFFGLDAFTAMLPMRCEAQVRFDWDLLPGVYSLCFMTQVNHGMSMSRQRALRKGEDGDRVGDERSIGKTATATLIHGEYCNSEGRMVPVKGNISKLSFNSFRDSSI